MHNQADSGRQPRPIPALRPDQRRIARHRARFKVVACGRRWGKTTLALAIAQAYARQGKRVWWVAPTYGMSFEPWLALKESLATQPDIYKLEAHRYLKLSNGGSIAVRSADNPDRLRGSGLDFVVLDEAAYIPRYVWESVLRPALSDRQGKALLISTPRARNWFYRVFQLGRDALAPDWAAWQAASAANPLIAAAEIEDVRRLLPERIFRQEYLAEFLDDGGAVFRNVQAVAGPSIRSGPLPGRRYMMGVDWGRHEDFTAVAVVEAPEGAEPPRLTALDRFSEVNWGMQRTRIAALARRWGVAAILAEANAMGEPNIEALQREGLPVAGFTMTARSKPPLIEALVKAIEDGELRLLDDPALLSELETFEYTLGAGGLPRYAAPAGLHDDTVIALALAWRLASQPRLALAMAEV